MRPPIPLTTATALLLATLTACGGSSTAATPTATPTTSAPAITADACRAYDAAITQLAPLIDGGGIPALVEQPGHTTAAQIRRAAQLATGQGRAVMEQSATRIEVLADKEASWTPTDTAFDDGPEAAAARASIVAVDRLCREAGASLSHVPAPAVSG